MRACCMTGNNGKVARPVAMAELNSIEASFKHACKWNNPVFDDGARRTIANVLSKVPPNFVTRIPFEKIGRSLAEHVEGHNMNYEEPGIRLVGYHNEHHIWVRIISKPPPDRTLRDFYLRIFQECVPVRKEIKHRIEVELEKRGIPLEGKR